MKKLLTTFLCGLLSAQTYAHIYYGHPSDEILVDGNVSSINEDPLQSYLKYTSDVDRVVKYDLNYLSPHHTDGIIRTWQVKENKLYLVSIITRDTKVKYELQKLFPDANGSVFASWYTGLITYSYGDFIGQIGDSFIFRYQKVYVISDGKVTRSVDIDNEKRALLYANTFLKNGFPLKEKPSLVPDTSGMTSFLKKVFALVNDGDQYESYDYPVFVRINIKANLDDLKFDKKYRNLSYHDLINEIVKQTGSTLDIRFVGGEVIYEIK